ncbi:MAG: TetR/AcrR family transcriptional regulator [Actinobacteria bacterium]|nr:TetR/AcrR family transcriptional regulator [Actinomycetota bacterium]
MNAGAPGPHRAGRPPSLSADQVVDAAIAIVDEVGLDGLSMAKIGARLGVGTMTLYSYVRDKEDLLDRMATSLFVDLEVPPGRGLERLAEYFRSFRRIALAHPALTRLLAGGRVTIPAVFDHLENLLTELQHDGVGPEESVRSFFSCLSYTIGFVVWEVPRSRLQPPEAYAAQWDELIRRLDPAAYPTVTRSARPHVGSVASDVQFEWGLGALLSGIGSSGAEGIAP